MNPLIVFLADFVIYLIYVLALGFVYWTKDRNLYLTFFTSFPIAWTIGWFIKNFFYVPRPFILSGQQPLINILMDGSFPSGHTIMAFSAALSVFIFHRQYGTLLLFLAFLVAAGRVLAGVHTWTDITGGIVIALLTVIIISKTLHTL
jgi:undecaprenyl-diphosphatase